MAHSRSTPVKIRRVILGTVASVYLYRPWKVKWSNHLKKDKRTFDLLTHEDSRTVQPTVSPRNSFSGRVTSCHSRVSLTSWTTGSVSQESYRGVLCAQSCKVGRLSQRIMAYCPTVVKYFRNKNKTCGRVQIATLRVECLTPECWQLFLNTSIELIIWKNMRHLIKSKTNTLSSMR